MKSLRLSFSQTTLNPWYFATFDFCPVCVCVCLHWSNSIFNDCYCQRLNVCAVCKFLCWKSDAQGDGTGDWSITKHGGWLVGLYACVSHSVVSSSLRPHGLFPVKFFCPCYFPDKNSGVGCLALLQWIFPTQGLNLGLLHCRQIHYCLSQNLGTH